MFLKRFYLLIYSFIYFDFLSESLYFVKETILETYDILGGKKMFCGSKIHTNRQTVSDVSELNRNTS